MINESTSYIGTLRNVIAPQLTSLNSKVKHFAVSPERVDPGNKSFDVKNTPRLVGGLTEEASNRAVAFYSSFSDHVVKSHHLRLQRLQSYWRTPLDLLILDL